ncbi:hypothetical protein GALL_327700 [mine drainage metagenome]|uniref:Uncharacterized protein n=1 Tax=mine drainage metagenome TaxID=410659 RepID=A0A1J5QPS1_9ZZZZ
MSFIIRNLVFLTVLAFSNLADAREALWTAMMENIKVVGVSPQIHETLNGADPEARKSLEEAIRRGNAFIPFHFSFTAYDTSTENEDWSNDVAPLVMTNERWTDEYGNGGASMQPKQFGNHSEYRLTCPQISLISIEQSGQYISLVYRTISVGTLLDFYGDNLEFNLNASGEPYEVRLELDKSDKLVNGVIQNDKWQTWSVTRATALMKEFLGNHSTRNFTTKEHEKELVRTYQSNIKMMANAKAKFCK